MRNIRKASQLTVLAAALAAAFGTALAQDEAVKELTTPDNSIAIGIGSWTKDRLQQGIYDGMGKLGSYFLFGVDMRRRDQSTGTWFNLNVRELGLDTREASVEWLRQGDLGISLDYNRTPRLSPYRIYSNVTGFGTTTQTYPAANSANALAYVPGFGNSFELETVREKVGASVFKRIAPGLDLNVRFTNEDKTGNRHLSRGGQPEFVAEPINSRTNELDVSVNYTTERLQLQGGYNGSLYRNEIGMITSTLGATNFFLSQPMDNQAHQVFFNGGYNFTPSTRGTFKASYSRATQDEYLPTKNLTGADASLAGAPSNLGGRIDTSLVQLGLTSRVSSQLSWVANLRYHNLKDKTPQARYVQTGAGTCATTATCVDNTPLSFRSLTGKLEATFRMPGNFALVGGVDVKDQDRTVPVGAASIDATGRDRQRYVPFRANLDETTYRLQLRRSMSDTLNGSLSYLHTKRDGSAYTLTEEVESDEINPIHIADKKSDKWRLALDWAPMEQFSLQFNAESGRDKYAHDALREFGLQNGKTTLYSLDASFNVNENLQLTAWWSHDKSKAKQFNGRWSRGTLQHEADTYSHMTDKGESLGIGLRTKPVANLRVGADLQWTQNKSQYRMDTALTGLCGPLGYCTQYPVSGAATASTLDDRTLVPLPDITNKLTRLNLFAVVSLTKNSEIRYDFIHEKWRTDDWTWMFSNGTPFIYGGLSFNATGTAVTAANDGSMVVTQPRSTANFLGVRYIYKFQ